MICAWMAFYIIPVLSHWRVIVSRAVMQGLSRLLGSTSCFVLVCCNESWIVRKRTGRFDSTGRLKCLKDSDSDPRFTTKMTQVESHHSLTLVSPSHLTSYCFIEPVQLQPWFMHLAGRLAISRPAALSGNTWWWSQNTMITGKPWQHKCGSVWLGGDRLNESQRGEEDISLGSNAV